MGLEFRHGLDFNKVAEIVKALPQVIIEHGGPALYEEAETIMAASKEIVPILTGALRDSGTVVDPVYTKTGVEVTMGYGGLARNYSIVQHENPDYHHRDGRRYKFLQEPLYAALGGMDSRIAARIRSRITFAGGKVT